MRISISAVAVAVFAGAAYAQVQPDRQESVAAQFNPNTGAVSAPLTLSSNPGGTGAASTTQIDQPVTASESVTQASPAQVATQAPGSGKTDPGVAVFSRDFQPSN